MSFTVGHKLDSKERTDDVTSVQSLTFDELLLPDPVLMGLKKSGFFKPSPIQLKAIPLGRCGLDMVVQAKSGTGKTCVFSVIALEAVDAKSLSLQTIVLAPTREIALQIYGVISSIGQFIEGLNVAVFIGGTQVAKDRHRAKNCHIAIGSPGRMKQLIEMQILSVANVRLFVLDEADKLVEEGSFQSQINWIYSSLPPRKQMLALSATYPEALAAFLKRYMFQPQFVRLNPKDPSLLGIRQFYYKVVGAGLPHELFEKKTETIIELLGSSSFQQALVFSNYHSRAQSLSEALNSCGWPSTFISGNMEQFLRIEAITKLKEFKCRVLISTDLTARGIDAYNVDLVINMDVPLDWETYMHRIGRAGRYGSKGIAVSLIGTEQEMSDFSAIASQCNAPVSELTDLSDMQTSGAIQQKPLVRDPQENSRKPIETNGRKQDTPPISNGANFEKRLSNGNTNRPWNRKQQSVKPTKNKTTKTNSSTEESQESSSNDQYDNGDKNSISGQKENQTPFEFPEIPSLPELNRRCNVHRRNEHYRRMNLEQLTADLAHFQLHGDFAPPPTPPPTQSQDTEEIPRESNSTGDGLSRDEKPLETCKNNSNSLALREPHLVVTSSLSGKMPPTPPSSSKTHAPVTASQNVGLNHNSSVGQKMASKNERQSDTRVKANQSFKEQRNPTVPNTRPKLSRRTSNARPKLSRRQSSASSSSLSWTSDSSSDSDCSNNLPEKQPESSQAFKPAPSYPAGQMAGFESHQLCGCYFCTSDRIYADYVQQKALAHARYCIDFAFRKFVF